MNPTSLTNGTHKMTEHIMFVPNVTEATTIHHHGHHHSSTASSSGSTTAGCLLKKQVLRNSRIYKPLISSYEVSTFQYHLHFLSTSMLIVVGWSVVVLLGLVQWPGRLEQHDCVTNYLTEDACFCEKPRRDWIFKQPVNTVSNLAYAACALLCAWSADRKVFPRNKLDIWFCQRSDLMIENRYFSMSFCLVLANISYCSALYHAGWILEGQILDLIALYAMFFWLMYFSLIKLSMLYFGWDPRNIAAAAKIHGLLMIMTIATISTMFLMSSNNLPPRLKTMLYKAPTGIAALGEVIFQTIHGRLNHRTHKLPAGQQKSSQALYLFLAILFLVVGFLFQVRKFNHTSNFKIFLVSYHPHMDLRLN